MKVLLIAPGFSVHAKKFINMLLDSGHAVTLLDNHNAFPEGMRGYSFIPYPGIKGFHRLNRRIRSHLQPWIRATQTKRIWQQVKPDVVNVQGVDWRSIYCAKAKIRPLVLSCWGSDINDLFDTHRENAGYIKRLASLVGVESSHMNAQVIARYRAEVGKALAFADQVTADSERMLARCEELAGHKLQTTMFYLGVDPERFKPGYDQEAKELRACIGIPSHARVVLSIRAIQPLMGHNYILEAFARICNEPHLQDVVLVFKRYLVSSFPEEYKNLILAIERLGLSERVYWLDEISPALMPAQYAMADLVINYPEQDAFPVTFLEAAFCKTPVVTSNLPDYDGMFDDSFFKVPSNRPAALAEALKICLTEKTEDRVVRTERAYKLALEKGSFQSSKEVINKVFNSVVTTGYLPGGDRLIEAEEISSNSAVGL